MTQPLSAIADNVILVEGMPSMNPNDGHGSPDGLTGQSTGYYTRRGQQADHQELGRPVHRQHDFRRLRPAHRLAAAGRQHQRQRRQHQYYGGATGTNLADDRLAALRLQHRVRRGHAQREPRLDRCSCAGRASSTRSPPRSRACNRRWGAPRRPSWNPPRLDPGAREQADCGARPARAPCPPRRPPIARCSSGPRAWTRWPPISSTSRSSSAAFACDITRIACLQYGNDQYLLVNQTWLPAADEHGGYIHSEVATNFPNLVKFEAYLATQFANMVTALATTPDPLDTTKMLLDNTLVALVRATWATRPPTTSSRCASSWRAATAAISRRPRAAATSSPTERHERILLNCCEALGVSDYSGFGDPNCPNKSPLPDIAA